MTHRLPRCCKCSLSSSISCCLVMKQWRVEKTLQLPSQCWVDRQLGLEGLLESHILHLCFNIPACVSKLNGHLWKVFPRPGSSFHIQKSPILLMGGASQPSISVHFRRESLPQAPKFMLSSLFPFCSNYIHQGLKSDKISVLTTVVLLWTTGSIMIFYIGFTQQLLEAVSCLQGKEETDFSSSEIGNRTT